MFSIVRVAVPEDALLKTYRGSVRPERWGRYGDCFTVDVDRPVSLSEFVFAFYTSPVFRIERLLLGAFAHAPSSDADVRAVANGSAASFAVWYVGKRTPTQLLMCDRYERTRSWFRVLGLNSRTTSLQFGSAVATIPDNKAGPEALGGGFRLLLGCHVLYSQTLLLAAKRRVMRMAGVGDIP